MMRPIKVLGVVTLLFGLSAVVLADEVKGKIKSVDTKRNEVVVKGTVKDSIYELKADASVWLDGVKCKLADLTADDRVAIVYDKKGEHMIATRVRALRKAQEAAGTVKDVLGDKRQLVLKGTVKNTTYDLLKEAVVWIDGKQSKLTDIRDGDQVLITYETRGDYRMASDIAVTKRK